MRKLEGSSGETRWAVLNVSADPVAVPYEEGPSLHHRWIGRRIDIPVHRRSGSSPHSPVWFGQRESCSHSMVSERNALARWGSTVDVLRRGARCFVTSPRSPVLSDRSESCSSSTVSGRSAPGAWVNTGGGQESSAVTWLGIGSRRRRWSRSPAFVARMKGLVPFAMHARRSGSPGRRRIGVTVARYRYRRRCSAGTRWTVWQDFQKGSVYSGKKAATARLKSPTWGMLSSSLMPMHNDELKAGLQEKAQVLKPLEGGREGVRGDWIRFLSLTGG